MMSDAVAFNSRRANTVKFDTERPVRDGGRICPAKQLRHLRMVQANHPHRQHVRRAQHRIMDMRNVLPSDSRATGLAAREFPRCDSPKHRSPRPCQHHAHSKP